VAVQQTTRSSLIHFFIVGAALIAAFFIASVHLTRESLWGDEGYTLWMIRDSGRPPDGFIETAQFIRNSLTAALARVRADVHPPLYFLALDGWVMLAGESIFVVRLLSALFGMIGLAMTYAVGVQWFDRRMALIALIVLATHSFFVYYTREARMYTLLLALAAFSTFTYTRWLRRPTIWRSGIYGLSMALLLYTHYLGVLLMLTQLIHLLVIYRQPRYFLPYLLAALLYIPWVPALLAQLQAQGGPSALPVPSDWGAILALLLILTSGHWGLSVVSFVLGDAVSRIQQHGSAIFLLLLWLLVTPLVLLAVNAGSRPIFQIRYTIAVLPAWALLVAYGLRYAGNFQWLKPLRNRPVLSVLLPLALIVWLSYTQLAMYTQFWPDKPRWEEAVRQMMRERDALEPAITSITPQSPAAYYDRLLPYHIRQGIALDLSWRWQEPDDIRGYLEHVKNSTSVWVVMPSNYASTWDTVSGLLAGRHVGYRDTVMNMIFYRFDSGRGDSLHFRFGDALNYEGGIGHQLYARAGEQFCFEVNLVALKPLDEQLQIEWQLTQGYGTVRARTIMPIGIHQTRETFSLKPCIDVPLDNPPGPHHLRMSVNDTMALPLIESENLYWDSQLIVGLVSVESE
jgi:uncharacterized membrane protein